MVADQDHPETLAPAVEAARLAREYGSDARQRFRPEGGLDVVVMQRSRMMLHRIDPDGSSWLCETHPPVRRHVWGRRILFAAGVVLVAGVVGPLLIVGLASAIGFGPIDLDRVNGWSAFVGTAVGAGFAGAFVLGLIGALWGGNINVFEGLKQAKWDVAEWHEIPEVTGPAPRTRVHLEVSEQLAAKHDREAFMRDRPDGTAELVAASDGRLHRYVVDESGDVHLVWRSNVRRRYYVGLGFLALAGVAFIASLVTGFAGLISAFLWLFGTSFVSMLVGHALSADRRAAKLARPREAWLAIRLPRQTD